MKKYEQPAIELIKFSIMDVLTASETKQNFFGEGTGNPDKTSEENFEEQMGL